MLAEVLLGEERLDALRGHNPRGGEGALVGGFFGRPDMNHDPSLVWRLIGAPGGVSEITLSQSKKGGKGKEETPQTLVPLSCNKARQEITSTPNVCVLRRAFGIQYLHGSGGKSVHDVLGNGDMIQF